MDDFVARSIAPERFYTLLLGGFAALAVVLALVGIYGTMAYAVSKRTRESGIRMALGATAESLVGIVVGRGMALVSLGVLIGLGAALLTTRMLESFVFGVTPTDPLTMALGVVVCLVMGAVASGIPARRAARVDPVKSLRYE